VFAHSEEVLSHDEVLRLLFGALQPVLRFDAVAAVLCQNSQDTPALFTVGRLKERFAHSLAEEVVNSFRQFSGESHQGCSRGPLQVKPLGREGPASREPWSGPVLSTVDAPLIMQGRVVGLVRVMAAAADAFPPEKSGIIYASAHQASALLERLDELWLAERKRLESLVNGLQDGIIMVDQDMRAVLANTAAHDLLAGLVGSREVTDVRLEETPLAGLVREALKKKGSEQRQEFNLSEDSQRYLSVTAAPLAGPGAGEGVVLVLRDITEERLMQERLLQSEKMASVGQLVSGVAHELNNPLTGVTGFAQLLLARDLDEQTRRDVETIYGEAERAAKIVENLLSFARRRKAQKGLVNLNTLLERVLELRSYDLRVKNIDLELDLDPRLPLTMADPDQIQQVFFNIITNAEHAILSAHGQGKLTVRSRSDKGYVRLSFADDGAGIPPENLRRVFDPFFTTKEGGQGTGLGLTISYGIVDDHGGRIRVESRPGRGTTFTVDLPIVRGPEPSPPKDETEKIRPPEISRRILVVDDEESILTLLRDVLNMDGHRVDTARSGAEALTFLAEHGYDLLITDIKMPGMSGQAFYRRVKETDSELARHTVFITGDTVNAETRNFLQRVDNPCLAKPFKMGEIREMVDRVLGREG
jgi:two-component system NtrC family sensor kinase